MPDVALSDAAAAGPRGHRYKRSPEDVAERLDVDPAVGLSSERAAELLAQHGPNALPVERAIAGWRRFLQQYRSYMQMFNRLLKTEPLKAAQFGLALAAAVLLLVLWEIGKLIARRRDPAMSPQPAISPRATE